MSASSGSKAVIAALASNVAIAVGKLIAFAFTGSASMLAEAIHSLADSGNQLLLMLGSKRASRKATAAHPFGYGRDRYVHAFIVAIILFSAGGLFAEYQGIGKVMASVQHPRPLEHWPWAIGALLMALLLEGMSFRTAVEESNEARGKKSWVQFVQGTKSPELIVVLFEDFGALIGLGLAMAGVGLSVLTGNSIFDGIATMGIGLLLVSVAIVLVTETRSLLLGESAAPEAVSAIEDAISGTAGVDRLIHLRTMHLGPEELLIGAKIAVRGASSAAEVAVLIDAVEARIRDAVPVDCVIYLEPDIDRGVGNPGERAA